MFRRKSTVVITAVLMLAMLALGGCGSSRPATLEEYAAEHPDQVKSIEDEITAMQTDTMIPSVEYDGNIVIMVLTLTETFEGEDMIETLAEAFEEGIEAQGVGEVMASDVAQLSEQLGIEDIKARVELRNGDGSVIWTETYGGEEEDD